MPNSLITSKKIPFILFFSNPSHHERATRPLGAKTRANSARARSGAEKRPIPKLLTTQSKKDGAKGRSSILFASVNDTSRAPRARTIFMCLIRPGSRSEAGVGGGLYRRHVIGLFRFDAHHWFQANEFLRSLLPGRIAR